MITAQAIMQTDTPLDWKENKLRELQYKEERYKASKLQAIASLETEISRLKQLGKHAEAEDWEGLLDDMKHDIEVINGRLQPIYDALRAFQTQITGTQPKLPI